MIEEIPDLIDKLDWIFQNQFDEFCKILSIFAKECINVECKLNVVIERNPFSVATGISFNFEYDNNKIVFDFHDWLYKYYTMLSLDSEYFEIWDDNSDEMFYNWILKNWNKVWHEYEPLYIATQLNLL